MTSADRVLFVAWQDQDTRRIFPVARLVQLPSGGGYELAYIRAVDEARAHGFDGLHPLNDFEAIYVTDELPPLLSNRLLPRTRPDFPQYISELDLAPEEAEPFTILARSGGRKATDRLEVFSPPGQTATGGYQGLFLARGVRHVAGASELVLQLKSGEALVTEADPQNKYNAHALLMLRADRRPIGYVPDYLATELAVAGGFPDDLGIEVVRVNPPPAPLHHRVLCRFICDTELGPKLFRSASYEPVSSRATQLAA